MATAGKAALREQAGGGPPQRCRRRSRRRGTDAGRPLGAGRRAVGSTVCAYVPVGSEPGSIDDARGVAAPRGPGAVAGGAHVGADDRPLPLRWGEYRPDGLVAARWGLLEPPEPWLPESALAEAGVVLLPALAVDRSGVRLGRGRGFYDRSLAARDPRRPAGRDGAGCGTGRRVAVGAARRADDPRAHPGARARLRCRPGNDPRHVAVLALETVEC